MTKLIKDHWFRADYTDEPCRYTDCGRSQDEHVESVGEWGRAHNHLFLPSLPSIRCVRCKRAWAHTWHYGSKKHRRIYDWNTWFLRLRDRVVGHERICWHLSHRVKMPCWRSMYSTCSGLCEKHYDSCREGCP